MSPEEIHFQHPRLSLAQIHGALTYYYEHQADLDARIADSAREHSAPETAQRRSELQHRLADLKRVH